MVRYFDYDLYWFRHIVFSCRSEFRALLIGNSRRLFLSTSFAVRVAVDGRLASPFRGKQPATPTAARVDHSAVVSTSSSRLERTHHTPNYNHQQQQQQQTSGMRWSSSPSRIAEIKYWGLRVLYDVWYSIGFTHFVRVLKTQDWKMTNQTTGLNNAALHFVILSLAQMNRRSGSCGAAFFSRTVRSIIFSYTSDHGPISFVVYNIMGKLGL